MRRLFVEFAHTPYVALSSFFIRDLFSSEGYDVYTSNLIPISLVKIEWEIPPQFSIANRLRGTVRLIAGKGIIITTDDTDDIPVGEEFNHSEAVLRVVDSSPLNYTDFPKPWNVSALSNPIPADRSSPVYRDGRVKVKVGDVYVYASPCLENEVPPVEIDGYYTVRSVPVPSYGCNDFLEYLKYVVETDPRLPARKKPAVIAFSEVERVKVVQKTNKSDKQKKTKKKSRSKKKSKKSKKRTKR